MTRKNPAVMAQRIEPKDSLDDFPTPPWATRALVEEVLMPVFGINGSDCLTCWEPAANRGLMAEPLSEYFAHVHGSDVHDYGSPYGYAVGDFLAPRDGLQLGDRATCPFNPHWVITNPPFNLAPAFLERALREAMDGVALLLRTAWIAGCERYDTIFSKRPPNVMAQFVERVPIVKGRWDPDADTATDYAWFCWNVRFRNSDPTMPVMWIPPGAEQRHTQPDDVARFAKTKEEAAA